MQPQTTFNLRAEHGEGPVWDPVKQTIYWVDLIQGKIYEAKYPCGGVKTYSVGQPVGVVALREVGGLVLAVRDGFGFLDPDTGDFRLIEQSPERNNAEVRFNDGAVDPEGRFLAGTMSWDGIERLGKLYALNVDHTWHQLEEQLFISNGMAWSADAKIFYFIDTLQHALFSYRYDCESGRISNKRVHIQFAEYDYPDGMATDVEGGFWIAFYGGSKVIHFDASGKELEKIELPVLHPTSCCFGGPDMSTLFITTSQIALSDRSKSDNPTAGCLFSIETSTVGVEQRRFRG